MPVGRVCPRSVLRARTRTSSSSRRRWMPSRGRWWCRASGCRSCRGCCPPAMPRRWRLRRSGLRRRPSAWTRPMSAGPWPRAGPRFRPAWWCGAGMPGSWLRGCVGSRLRVWLRVGLRCCSRGRVRSGRGWAPNWLRHSRCSRRRWRRCVRGSRGCCRVRWVRCLRRRGRVGIWTGRCSRRRGCSRWRWRCGG